ncbi:aminoglycoside N(3)-acetyltransferase [Actinomadura sp. WMMA1423]|uniref:aminoglycoside N(3)-acetyltransferase n=1 Tax=Actinomadura sp. WMMA1423 TaxID=2591108 RepID=UPI001F114679|nr:AAC(3) family N-acetyltransferase [Actinomadura sp. WMMA1423]
MVRRTDTSEDHPAAVGRAALADDLRALGVRPGSAVLVHASLRSVGPVEGGAATVAGALGEVLGPEGTIVVPTATAENSDSSRAYLERTRGMSSAERERFNRSMPAFDLASTPSTGMGVLAEHIRTSPGACRSGHPQTSFAALGAEAAHMTAAHAPDCHYGERSPLAKLYEAEADILLIGVGYDRCTALHLAEYRYRPAPPTRTYRCVIERGGRPVWWEYEDVVLDDGDFAALGRALDRTRHVVKGRVGRAGSCRVPVRAAVEFACAWLADTRGC